MTLKVAHKVMLGFAVILLLLLAASISSFRILVDIQGATSEVDELALPVQQLSNKIQILLLKQAKQSSLIASAEDLAKVNQLEQQFLSEGKQLALQSNQLKTMLVGQSNAALLPKLHNLIKATLRVLL